MKNLGVKSKKKAKSSLNTDKFKSMAYHGLLSTAMIGRIYKKRVNLCTK